MPAQVSRLYGVGLQRNARAGYMVLERQMENIRLGSYKPLATQAWGGQEKWHLCSWRNLQVCASLANILKLVKKFLHLYSRSFSSTASVLCLSLSCLVYWLFQSKDLVCYSPLALLELCPTDFHSQMSSQLRSTRPGMPGMESDPLPPPCL